MSNWLPGRKLKQGQYVVEKELGTGGFGVTYKVRETGSNSFYAIKTLQPKYKENKEYREFEQLQSKFINESVVLASCRHPHIVRIHGNRGFFEDGLWCMVMDFIEGEDLKKYLENRNIFSEDSAVNLIRKIGKALTLVHQKNYLHRDVNPNNILLRACDLSPVLIDFGLAREHDPNNPQILSVALTPGFAPIEQYTENKNSGAWTDVYGLSATLYILSTNKRKAITSRNPRGISATKKP